MDVSRTVEKVLLVDDWETQLNQWERDCASANKLAFRARTRADAVVIAHDEKPDVAIVDLFLGTSESGLDVVRDLKALDPNMYIVLVSAHLSVDFAMLGRDAGANDCASKAVRCKHLLDRAEHGRRVEPEPNSVPTLAQVEWDHISRVLNDCGGNITRAAEALGEHRYTLQRIIRKNAPSTLRPKTPKR